MRSLLSFVGLVGLLLVASPARAQMYRDGPPPKHRVVWRDLNVIRWNPIGLISDGRLSYRLRLYESQSKALRDNFVSIGVAPVLSGGFSRLGAVVEFQPLTMLNLWASYEVVGYYGAFNFLQSFTSATANYSDSELARLGDLTDGRKNYAAVGTQLNLGANFQIKVKDIVARTQLRVARPSYDLRAGDRVMYDIFFDLLAGNEAWLFNNDTDLLWQNDNGLTVGVRWTQARAFYDDRHFAADDDRSKAPGTLHRAGPMLAYTWKKPDGARFEPTLLVVANWWLSNPNRTGQDTAQAIPYFVLGYAMTGDLLGDG